MAYTLFGSNTNNWCLFWNQKVDSKFNSITWLLETDILQKGRICIHVHCIAIYLYCNNAPTWFIECKFDWYFPKIVKLILKIN